jgi:hypothetical protein
MIALKPEGPEELRKRLRGMSDAAPISRGSSGGPLFSKRYVKHSRMRRRLGSDVEKLLEFFPGGRLKTGYIAAEFIGVENLPHCRLKARELGSKIRILIRCPGEGWQLLADQIVQRVFDAETLTNRGRNRALLLPDLVKVHGKLRGEQLYRLLSDISKIALVTRHLQHVICIRPTATEAQDQESRGGISKASHLAA